MIESCSYVLPVPLNDWGFSRNDWNRLGRSEPATEQRNQNRGLADETQIYYMQKISYLKKRYNHIRALEGFSLKIIKDF